MLAKSTKESFFVVHENGVGYSTKWMRVRYCQIAIFQGFRAAILGRESGPENSRRGGGKMTVSWGVFLAAINLCLGTGVKSRSRAGVSALRPTGQQITLARLVLRNRTLKTVQRLGPKFHAFQILVQALDSLGEIANDLVFCRFRHVIWPCLAIDVSTPVVLRRLVALWFRSCQLRMTEWQTNLGGTSSGSSVSCEVASVPTGLTPLR